MALLRARGMRASARDIGVSARLAARLVAKLERLQYRLADAEERRLLSALLRDTRWATTELKRLQSIAEKQAGVAEDTLPDGRIVRR
jgi:hypothetical protein